MINDPKFQIIKINFKFLKSFGKRILVGVVLLLLFFYFSFWNLKWLSCTQNKLQ